MELQQLKNNWLNDKKHKGSSLFLLVIILSICFIIINILLYQLEETISWFRLLADLILLTITFLLIILIQRQYIDKRDFYYSVYIGFTLIFFGLLILTLDNIFIYVETIVDVSIKLLFVFGYSLLAVGVFKWNSFNKQRQNTLEIQASTDELTGMLNRRSFTSYIDFEFVKAKTRSEPFSLIILDIDYFKAVNDSHGHMIGDKILTNLAASMEELFRNTDKVCRWGGEEFAILLPNTSLRNAETVAEKIRQKIEDSSYVDNDLIVKYTISLGVSEWLTSDENVDNIISRADDALYRAKKGGRNRIYSIRA